MIEGQPIDADRFDDEFKSKLKLDLTKVKFGEEEKKRGTSADLPKSTIDPSV